MPAATPPRETISCNAPWDFWRLAGVEIDRNAWISAAREARSCLSGVPAADRPADVLAAIASSLTETQFGPDHFRLSAIRRLYYTLRPFLPVGARPLLHRLSALSQQRKQPLAWPVEDRYVRF